MNKHIKNKHAGNRGAAIITAVIFFVIISTTVALGLSSPVVREYVTARDFEKSKGAYYLSEAGIEDVIYRIKKTVSVSSSQVVLSLGGNTATTTINSASGNKKTISTVGDITKNTRRTKATLSTVTGVSFVYGLLAGTGGLSLENSSSITGNLYSAGPVIGSSNNVITGSVISAGTTGTDGSITGVQNQGGNHMYAGTISNSAISGSAYCNTITGSLPSTTMCKTLSMQAPADLPITAQDVANWEAAATSTVTCTAGKYTISTSVDFGPVKVPCDLVIDGSGSTGPTVTLKGPVWVTGNIDTNGSSIIRVDPTKVGEGMVVIADNPSDRTNSSKITLKNQPVFRGAGANSYVMMLSENTSASTGGNVNAIDIQQGGMGDLLVYARLGKILIQQSASVSEVTAYKIVLQNTSNVVYTSGLQNSLFSTGPGGAWEVQGWKEGQ